MLFYIILEIYQRRQPFSIKPDTKPSNSGNFHMYAKQQILILTKALQMIIPIIIYACPSIA